MTPSQEGLPAKANDSSKVAVDITNSAADHNNPDSESVKQKKVEEETGGIGLILVTDHLLQKLQKLKPKFSTLAMPFTKISAPYSTPLYLLNYLENVHFASVMDFLFKLCMT